MVSKWFILLLLPLFLILSLSDISAASPDFPPEVIILNSYHPGFTWSDGELTGLVERLRQRYPQIDPAIEYLDTKHFPQEDYLLRVKDFLNNKYRGWKFDLVIVLDDSALKMVLEHRQELFPGVPVVFAGINDFQPSMLAGQEKVTGVAEVLALADTLETALALHPQTKEIFVVHDYTVTGQAVRKEMEEFLPSFHRRVKVSFSPPGAMAEIIARIKALPTESLVFIMPFATDKAGQSFSQAESTRLLTQGLGIPAYSFFVDRLGHGLVGGILLGGKEHGSRAGDLALRVLSGEDPSRIPVVMKSTARPMFDYRQLRRFNIPVASLPPGSIIINRPLPFYEKYKYLTLALSWIIVFLILTVAILSLAIVRQRQAQAQQKQAEEKVRLNEARLASLWRISQYSPTSIQELLDYALDEAIALTGSKIGYIYLYDENTQQFTLNTWSKEVMQVCTIAEPRTIYQLEKTGIWGEAVRQARPIMVNDFQGPHPLKKGCPEGHAPLYKYLTIPVISNNHIVAVVGVANKTTDYDDADVRQLTLMMDAVWKIVERRRAEEELRRSEARLTEAQRIAQMGSWEWNLKTNQAIWSDELFRIFHLPPQQYGLNFEDFLQYVPPEERESLRQSLAEVLANRKPFSTDCRIILGDGSPRYVHVGAEIILDESGEPALMQGTVQDITARVLAEQKLREVNERFAAVFENAAIGISVSDAQGRILATNPSFQEMLGYAAGELLAKLFSEITHPEDLPQNLELFQEMMLGKSKGFQLEKRYLRKNGEYFWARVTVSSIKDPKGQPRYSIAVVEDITQQKQAQEKLRESEQKLRSLASQLLTAQEKERRRICSELHDELGHSLLIMKLHLGSIERELHPDQQALAEEIESLFHYIDEVIENLRRLYLDLAPGGIEDLGLTAALQTLIEEYAKNNQEIQWSVNLTNIDGHFILSEEIAIYRIIQEILTNIGKHADSSMVSVRIQENDKRVFFEVEDNGKGFTREDAKHSIKGMGLLAMEERIRMLGGSLEVWSQKNQGTKITFSVPISNGLWCRNAS